MFVGLFIDDERTIKVVARSATVGLLDESLYFKFGHTVPCIALQAAQTEECEGAQEMGYLWFQSSLMIVLFPLQIQPCGKHNAAWAQRSFG